VVQWEELAHLMDKIETVFQILAVVVQELDWLEMQAEMEVRELLL
jgi:hypothetical protein